MVKIKNVLKDFGEYTRAKLFLRWVYWLTVGPVLRRRRRGREPRIGRRVSLSEGYPPGLRQAWLDA